MKFSIPLAIIIFATVTIRIKVSFVDGPNYNYYGFPLPYLRWCGFSSLEYNLDLLKLITDLLFYISLCTAIVSYKPLFSLLNNYKKIVIISPLFLSAVPLFFYGLYTEIYRH